MPGIKDRFAQSRTWTMQRWERARTWARGRRWVPPSYVRRKIALGVGAGFGAFAGLILVLGVIDWNYLKGPVESVLSARAHRSVKIDGDLDVTLISWTPGATVEGLRVSNPVWAGGGDMAKVERLAVKVKLLPLFKGDVVLPLLSVDKPVVRLVRLADGRNNWTFGRKSNDAFSLPPIRRFEIRNGDVTINDGARRLVFKGMINSSEIAESQQRDGFRLTGDGTLNDAPFEMQLTGGPLLNVDPGKPYPFDATVRAGDTHIAARGSIAKPFDLAVFDTTLTASGQDAADLYYLTAIALPNTPPYSVTGRFSRRGLIYTYDGLNGRVGDSDIHGHMDAITGGDRLMLSGNLNSNQLDFNDLMAVFGGGADTRADEDTSPEQAQRARELQAEGRMFPDTPMRVERFRSMDAQVTYAARSIRSENFPFRAGSVKVDLDNGLLNLNPLTLDLSNGRLAGLVRINARHEIPATDVDLRLANARIDEFIPVSFKGAISGPLYGRVRLAGTGMSLRDAAAASNGQFTLVIPQGQMRESLAELLGVNLLRGLFTDRSKTTELRCGVADFKVTNGMMNAQTIVLDTGPVIAIGGGQINLKTETMALDIKGHPKEARFFRLSAPIKLSGPIRRPAMHVVPDNAIGQGGIALVLATVLAPITAVLPFVDPGLSEDANCQALVAQAGTGARVPVQRTAENTSPKAKVKG